MKQQDPLALAIFGAALALLAGLLLYVFFLKAPEPAPSGPGLLEQARQRIDDLRKPEAQPQQARPRPPAAKSPPAPAKSPPAAAPAPASASRIETRAYWRYNVSVDPPAWTNAKLTYLSHISQADGALRINTYFDHDKGQMNFNLGVFAAGHPSHANTRFPGFFMHPAYFPQVLKVGQKFSWGWAWQPERAGRVKRYEGKVTRMEEVTVPAGTFRTAVIEADLYYIEAGEVRAQARETLWVAPEVQIVKVVREGRTPDEAASRIVAELRDYTKN